MIASVECLNGIQSCNYHRVINSARHLYSNQQYSAVFVYAKERERKKNKQNLHLPFTIIKHLKCASIALFWKACSQYSYINANITQLYSWRLHEIKFQIIKEVIFSLSSHVIYELVSQLSELNICKDNQKRHGRCDVTLCESLFLCSSCYKNWGDIY